MSFTVIKKADGSSVIVSNVIADTGGGGHAVVDDALTSIGGALTIFSATVEVNPVQVVNFRLSDSVNRMFRL